MTLSSSAALAQPESVVSRPEPHRSTSASSAASCSSQTTTPRLSPILKPIGIHNEQNTCFFNSTFQALSATAPLISLLASNPALNKQPSNTSILPSPPTSPSLIPSLNPATLEPPLYQLLPVTRAFTNSLNRAWIMKDAGGGTSGLSETSSTRSMSLRSLLREIAKKYDQYDDYRQQDAHELLRHLLDSMEMEEKDVIKRLQPPASQSGSMKKSRSAKRSGDSDVNRITPLPSAGPSSPVRHTSVDPIVDYEGSAKDLYHSILASGRVVTEPQNLIPDSSEPVVVNSIQQIHENERMIPFVDVLFGGSLASVVVCETCKSVSHTYEGFLDISLSLKGDDPKPRKRDRLRAMAQRLRPRGSPKTPGESTSSSPVLHPIGVVSDTEGSDVEPTERNRRKSMEHDEAARDDGGLRRNGSTKGFGLRPKSSSIFRRKGSRTDSSGTNAATQDPSPKVTTQSQSASAESSPKVAAQIHGHGPSPTSAQSAYIQRILSGPPGPPEGNDPLARLRAAHSNDPSSYVPVQDTGLIDSLKAFTSVEVLEGENAFACKKCWKIKSGKYAPSHEAPLREENEDDMDALGAKYASHSPRPKSPSVAAAGLVSGQQAPPSISIDNSDLNLASNTVSYSPDEKSLQSHFDRHSSINSDRSHTSIRSSVIRAPSPLRGQIDASDRSSAIGSDLNSVYSNPRSEVEVSAPDDEDDSDGLSDSDSSDDEPPRPSDLPVGRPVMPLRAKSKHFVMRRAFKRYLIAKAPEILVFHFKRFKQTSKSSFTFSSFYNLKKMDDFISFPEKLDLAPFLAPDRNDYRIVHTPSGPRAKYMSWPSVEQGPPEPTPVMYKLYAVVVHLGTMLGGHYIAYCLVDPEKLFQDTSMPNVMPALPTDKDVQGATEKLSSLALDGSASSKKDRRVWCFCSDTSIRLASLDEVLNARAYLCFYEKMA